MSSDTEKSVSITILGKDYNVSCPEEEEYNLRSAAQHLNKKTTEIRSKGKIIGMERIAVMAALNISHELLQRDTELRKLSADTDDQISHLLNKMDSLLDS